MIVRTWRGFASTEEAAKDYADQLGILSYIEEMFGKGGTPQ